MGQFESEAIRNTPLRYAPQLQRIALQLTYEPFKSLLGIGLFPLLEQLVIALPFLHDEEAKDFLGLEIFDDAPQLGQLHFGRSATPWMFLPSHRALIKVTCERLTRDDFLDFLTVAPSLTDVIGSVQPGTIEQFYPFPPARHRIAALNIGWFSIISGLTELHLCAPDHLFIPALLARLIRTNNPTFLPHLQSLAFTDCELRVDTLKLLRSPFQKEFLCAPDVPWPAAEAAVCVVGAGAGNTTYLLVAQEGHSRDQPRLVTSIVEVETGILLALFVSPRDSASQP
ncbi:hypothetical protein DFH09DRAFT_1374619 [Mycena vulgaris]|nr:hypothetical protein DFH09DRAFT_1374619 [Mycena vulgaris]